MQDHLSRLEQRLAGCAARGDVLDCGPDGTTADVVDAVEDWDSRVIRADVLAGIATGVGADRPGSRGGAVRLRGALIAGRLDLAHLDLDAPIALEVCRFEEPVELTGARARSLSLTRCELPVLYADELETAHTLRLDHCTFTTGSIRLRGAHIGGELVLTGAKLAGTDDRGHALVADRLHVGAASLDAGFQAAGSVRLSGATIDSDLDMGGARLMGTDDGGMAVDAVGLRVGGEAFLSGGFEAAGALGFRGARIDGNFELTGATLFGTDPGGNALVGDGLRVGGGARLSGGFEAAGAVRLWGADIGARLDLRGARLAGTDANGDAFVADELHVGASAVLADRFEATGAVSLRGARIDGNLELNGARLAGADASGNALRANRLHVRGDLLMRDGVEASGDLRLATAAVDGHVAFVRARRLEGVVLEGARFGSIRHDRDSWPLPGELRLRGFQFGVLVGDTDWRQQLDWVRRQGFTSWTSDPYEQLADYYTRIGDESAARRVRIARHDDELTHLKRTRKPGSLAYRFWRRPFGWLVGYGYRRWPTGMLLAATLLAAGVVFHLADDAGAMTPSDHASTTADADDRQESCGDRRPCFNAAVYGADVVLPVIDFGQDSAWRPSERTAWGRRAAAARWFFIGVGWVLASVFVAAFTHLVQRG